MPRPAARIRSPVQTAPSATQLLLGALAGAHRPAARISSPVQTAQSATELVLGKLAARRQQCGSGSLPWLAVPPLFLCLIEYRDISAKPLQVSRTTQNKKEMLIPQALASFELHPRYDAGASPYGEGKV